MKAVFVRTIARPRPTVRRRRADGLGDFFSDITSGLNLTGSSDLTIPQLDFSGGATSPVLSLPDPETVTVYGPATSDSSWQGILNSVSNALKPITQAYSAVQLSNAAANAAKNSVFPVSTSPLAPVTSSIGSIFSGSYGPIVIGGFALLALSVALGSSGKRR